MPTATDTLPDLTSDQLAKLADRMRAAKEERHAHERAAQGKRQLLRGTRSKLTKVNTEIDKLRADQDVKLGVIVTLHERLQGVEEQNENDPKVRDERLALVEAIEMATENGAAITAGINCPTNARPFQLLNSVSPHGLSWHVPLGELGRRLEALTAEKDRLRARLEELEDDDTGEVAA